MKKGVNHIDEVFREGLKNFSQSAPEGVWDSIKKKINTNRNHFFTFYKMAAAVIAFVALGSMYLYLSNNNSKNSNEILVESKQDIPVKEENSAIKGLQEEKLIEIIVENDNQYIAEAAEKEVEPEIITDKGENVSEDIIVETYIAENRSDNFVRLEGINVNIKTKEINPQIIYVEPKTPTPDLYLIPDIYTSLALNDVEEDEGKKNKNKWIVGGEFSPLYSYRHLAGGSSNEKNYYNEVESPIMSYTGGLNVQYKAMDRLVVQAGVYYSTMGQSIDHMSVYSNSVYDQVAEEYRGRYINPYLLQNSSGDIFFNTPYVIVDDKLSRIDNLNDNKMTANVADPMFSDIGAKIQQNYRYIEVPVVVRYKLIDKLIDFNVVGGIGANFLIGNDVYLLHADNKELIGETEGLNKVNYSGCFGFGIDYPIMKRISLRLEPSIRYYINPISNSSSVDSHPYSFGIYTGFNYSF